MLRQRVVDCSILYYTVLDCPVMYWTRLGCTALMCVQLCPCVQCKMRDKIIQMVWDLTMPSDAPPELLQCCTMEGVVRSYVDTCTHVSPFFCQWLEGGQGKLPGQAYRL